MMRPILRPLLLALALAWCALALPSFVASLRPAEGVIDDFFQEWASARNSLSGIPVYLRQEIALEKHLAMRRVDRDAFWLDYNAHPPPSVLLVLPLGLLPYREAALTWNLLSLAALAASLRILQRELRWKVSTAGVVYLLSAMLFCSPLRQQIHHGQLNPVLLWLLAAAWKADRAGYSARAGSFVALATAIKLFPGFVFVYFLARRDGKALAAGAATFLAITGLTAAVLGIESYSDYIFTVLPTLGHFRQSWLNASLAGFWHRLFNASSKQTVPLWPATWLAHALTLGAAAIVTLMCGWRAWKSQARDAWVRASSLRGTQRRSLLHEPDASDCPPRVQSTGSTHGTEVPYYERPDLAYALVIVGMLLVSPVCWDHYFLLLTLPVAILWRTLPPKSAKRWLLAAIALVLCVNPRMVWDATIAGPREIDGGVALPWHSVTVLGFQLYLLVGLFAIVWRAGSEHESTAIRGGPTR
jgi:hypothetical protein